MVGRVNGSRLEERAKQRQRRGGGVGQNDLMYEVYVARAATGYYNDTTYGGDGRCVYVYREQRGGGRQRREGEGGVQ